MIILAILFLTLLNQSSSPKPADAHSVPTVDGAAGPCTADFTITDAAGAPVYAAKVQVHVDYRLGGFHKLDLEAGTNIDGKARFIGLPERTKHGLFFHASEGDREGSVFDDPASTCKAQFTIALQKKSQ